MIGFELNEEQTKWKEKARSLASEVRSTGWEIDHNPDVYSRSTKQIIKKLGQNGIMCMRIPKEYGGKGMDLLTCVVVIEELAVADAGIAFTACANTIPFLDSAEEKFRQKYWTLCCNKDDPGLLGFCLTEPGAGSDAVSIRTTANLEGNKWRINGTKCFSTGGGHCVLYVVFATSDPSKGPQGINAILVPGDSEGLSVGKLEDKMGFRSSHTAELFFDNVEVPKENLVGKKGSGLKLALQILGSGRIFFGGALGVGVARAALEAAQRFCQDRLSNNPGLKDQAISFQLADMATMVEAARLLLWEVAWLIDNKRPYRLESAMAKIFPSDAALTVASKACDIIGFESYSDKYQAEKYLRDAKVLSIGAGTNEINRMVLANELFGSS
jgi:alkylation response protein AidB-like acyl-CoA dehydrogenase